MNICQKNEEEKTVLVQATIRKLMAYMIEKKLEDNLAVDLLEFTTEDGSSVDIELEFIFYEFQMAPTKLDTLRPRFRIC